MTDKNTHESELIEEIKKLFGAIPENEVMDEVEKKFLQERAKVEELYSWDFDAFVKYFQLIEKYGLEEKILQQLAWKIEHFMSKNEVWLLKGSKFYEVFGGHRLIENAILNKLDVEEYE